MDEDFLPTLYATMNTVGSAKEAIKMLEVKHREDYSLIKCDQLDMFNVTRNQKLYENFLQKFKHTHTETVIGFYIKLAVRREQAHFSKYLDR